MTTLSDNATAVYAAAFLHTPGESEGGVQRGEAAGLHRLLLINKRNVGVTVDLADAYAVRCSALVVDQATALGPPRTDACTPDADVGGLQLTLAPYATAVVEGV